MELRFTYHATVRMQETGISLQEIQAVLLQPERMHAGETAVEYDGTVAGRGIRVVVVTGSEPPLVITVHTIAR